MNWANTQALLAVVILGVACGDAADDDDDGQDGGTGGQSGSGAAAGRNTGGASGRGGSSGSSGSSGSGGSTNTNGSGGASHEPGDERYFGETHTGSFWLGPVDYEESEWHNACAPSVKYPDGIRELYGNYIMGLANEVELEGLVASDGELCDTCVELQANGEVLIARVVTYGEETGPNDIDVSPEIDAALDGDANREANWRFVTCPTAEPVWYTFDGREWENTWFFRVWVRNARVPIGLLEYRIDSDDWAAAERQSDGAWQASGIDFSGGFAVRVTALDGQTLEDELPGLNTFDPDAGVQSHGNFD